jgi:hypothetical protein
VIELVKLNVRKNELIRTLVRICDLVVEKTKVVRQRMRVTCMPTRIDLRHHIRHRHHHLLLAFLAK